MKIIVGLGNPKDEYKYTRHNIGWLVIDYFLKQYTDYTFKNNFNSEIYLLNINNEKVLFVKPLTYMNNSGIAVRQIIDYYKISINDLLVIHDEKDFEIGKIQFKKNGSSAGHNGIKSIISNLKTENFLRLRIGIGKKDENWNLADWVLSKFSDEELNNIFNTISNKKDFLKDFLNNITIDKIMNKYN